ncbi:sugar-binding transcriptional regulator [Paracoccus seriniphilus]|uniref:DNA-binding transcriptional regulator LsrR, DeoR family n=1 Tax=Paracoccus seriniphilus TaxID=184748 RepID=A0A239Q145_9RHOB|nr:sugar-binding domain-containing protein [Paracoccus seriniphilus]WCR15799.1 transcriptional regulator [Paracoccus seriniphilus]SNT76150.1 DNA-binding transcriptional regulator LsrR, DeoR family [Paracoccus seriniphilus]
MSRTIKIDQIDKEEQLLVRLVWACEIEGLTQAEAAERFGTTRLRVNKGLREARRRGILRVSVDSIYTAAADLEWQMQRRFGLTSVNVVPSPEDPGSVSRLVSAGLGAHLGTLLETPEIKAFGMSWGNTLNLATRYMQPINRPDLEIISVMGGVSRGSDVNGYEIATRLADLCNAEHSFFTAPLFAGSPESQRRFVEQDVIAEMLDKVRSCDAVALATSDLRHSLLVRDALPRDIDPEDLIALGGVGDITGHVLDANGEMIDHPINQRVIGISLDDLARIPNVILAAGGAHKVPIILAALRRGIVDTLVTDTNTAQALLGAAGD